MDVLKYPHILFNIILIIKQNNIKITHENAMQLCKGSKTHKISLKFCRTNN